MPLRCELCGELLVCSGPHVGSVPKVGSTIQDCPIKKGAIWVYVKDDLDKGVGGVTAKVETQKDNSTDPTGFAPFDPLDERQYKASLGDLTEEMADKYLLPFPKEAFPQVTPGKITLVEFQVERIAPLKVTAKRSDAEAFVKDVTVKVTPPSPEKAAAKDEEKTPDGGSVEFKRLRKGDYSVKLTLKAGDELKYKFDDGDTKPWTLDPAIANELVFKLTPIIRIYLKLQFLDPEGAKRPFPKDLELVMAFEAGPDPKDLTVKVGDDGIVSYGGKPYVEVPRVTKSFQLKLTQSDKKFIACEKRGAPKTQELVAESDPTAGTLKTKLTAGGRIFSLPVGEWTLKNSEWDIVETEIKTATLEKVDYKFGGLDSLAAEVGSAATPVELTMKPAWQFVRFTYFDRCLDPTANPDQISILPVTISGYLNQPTHVPDPSTLTVQSNWTVGVDDKAAIQCVPWILKNPALATQVKPDKDSELRFITAANTFIKTEDAGTRSIVVGAQDTPNRARLQFYDLPLEWRSRNYFVRTTAKGTGVAGGKFVKDLDSRAKVLATIGAPLIFSLDDIVLCDGTGGTPQPMAALTADDHPAIFNHRFNDTIANCTKHGVYKLITAPPDSDHTPASDVTPVNNYVNEYPDWTRLITANGNLFDVFNQRTPADADPTRVVGARAAVRWSNIKSAIANVKIISPPGWFFDVPSKVVQSGVYVPTPPPPTKVPAANPFFASQLYFSQQTSVRYSQQFNPFDSELVGRFDIALIRCCGKDATDEIAVNFHYLRSHYDFSNLASPPNLLNPGGQGTYALNFGLNVANRWNGDEPGVNDHRAQLLPQIPSPPAPTPPVKFNVVWFPQSVPLPDAHFKVMVEEVERDNRGSELGTGQSGPKSFVETPGMQHWFPAAHESGHMNALPDEYNERWDGASYGQLSFKQNLPGDPYEPDGRTETSDLPNSPMMNGNRLMRNRYFWHAAEWVRTITNIPLRVKYGAYDNFFLPAHARASEGRSYYPWPVKHVVGLGMGGFSCDLFLYRLGKEEYSESLIASPPVDGVLVIVVRFKTTLPDDVNLGTEKNMREDLLSRIAATTRQFVNGRWYATGNIVVSPPNQNVYFRKCLLQFTPQYLVENHPHSSPPRLSPPDDTVEPRPAYARRIEAALGHSAKLILTPGISPPDSLYSPPDASLNIRFQNRNDIEVAFYENFLKFWDMPSPPHTLDPSLWEPWVNFVIPGGRVRRLK